MMMKFNIKNVHEWPLSLRSGVVFVIFLITLFLGYYFDLSSMSKQLDAAVQQEDDLKQQYQSLITHKAVLKHDLSHLPELRAQLVEWKKSIIKHEELAELLNTILKTGANNHLYISLFEPEAAAKEDEYEKLPIKVIVVGSYHQLADFISQLANTPQLVVIGDFIMSNENKNDVLGSKLAQQANEQNLLTAEMKLAIYYQPEAETEVNVKKKA